MATSNKIVDTRRLAAQGRFGDTEMRNVRGKPSHVTALEAYHMDTVGVQPSASNKSINPMTGLPEYHGAWGISKSTHPGHHNIGEMVGGTLDLLNPVTRIVTGYEKLTGQDTGYDTMSELFADPGGTTMGQWWTENVTNPLSKTEREIESQSKDIMTGGMENLQTQYGQYMGPEGFLTREQDIREEGITDVYQTSRKKIGKTGDMQRSRSNLAYSGTIESGIKEATEKAQSTYETGMDVSALTAEKGEADFMGGLRKQMNQMLLDYQGATDEAYGGGELFDQLNALFANYSANV